MTFKLKKMGKNQIDEYIPAGVYGKELENYRLFVGEASQANLEYGARQVVEWGDSDCPHVSHSRGKHWCGECWQSLKLLGVPE